jgi:hypothetical protein
MEKLRDIVSIFFLTQYLGTGYMIKMSSEKLTIAHFSLTSLLREYRPGFLCQFCSLSFPSHQIIFIYLIIILFMYSILVGNWDSR